MIEITNKIRVKVTRYLVRERDGCYISCGTFISDVYALSSNEKNFLVYDDLDAGFVWVDFTKRIAFDYGREPEPVVKMLAT